MEMAFAENPVYAAMAVVGTLLYLIKFVMLLMAGDGDGDVTTGDDAALDGGESFSLISIQSVLAFFMGCGWMGLTTSREWGMEQLPALGISALFGFVLMWLSAFLTFKIKKLNYEPKIDLKEATGKTGRAYTNIPEKDKGVGQVEITVGGKQQILQAMSTGESIDAFAAVKVEKVDDSGNLIVTKS